MVPKSWTPILNVRLAATEVVSIRLKADWRLKFSGWGSVHLVVAHEAKLVLHEQGIGDRSERG
jgi:hypothetical protein